MSPSLTLQCHKDQIKTPTKEGGDVSAVLETNQVPQAIASPQPRLRREDQEEQAQASENDDAANLGEGNPLESPEEGFGERGPPQREGAEAGQFPRPEGMRAMEERILEALRQEVRAQPAIPNFQGNQWSGGHFMTFQSSTRRNLTSGYRMSVMPS